MKCRFCAERVKLGDFSTTRERCNSCPKCWNKPFFFASVSRSELEEYFSEKEIAALDDAEMESLADSLEEKYRHRRWGFWWDLQTIPEKSQEDG